MGLNKMDFIWGNAHAEIEKKIQRKKTENGREKASSEDRKWAMVGVTYSDNERV